MLPAIRSIVVQRARRRPDAIVALVILLLPVVVFAHALAPGKVLSPADNLLTLAPWRFVAEVRPGNPLANDVTFMFHPWLIYAAREIGEGRFPLWNPYVFAGSPFFANPQTAILFPLNVLAWMLPPPAAVTVIAVLKLSLAGLGTFWLLRLLAVSRMAALVGAATFMFSGVLAVWLQWSYGNAIACLPLLLAATERLRQRPTAPGVAALALAVGADVFAGYPQGTVQGALLCGAWAVACLARTARRWRFLALVVAGLVLGGALGAVQLIPFAEYVRSSSVLHYRDEWFPVLTLPIRSAITFLMPYYYGSAAGRDFWGYWNFNEITVSVGLVPWLALPLALLARWSRIETRFFAVAAALGGAVLYGVPVLTPLLAGIPPFSLTIGHRIAPVVALALAVLGALGVDAAAGMAPGRRRTAGWMVRVAFLVLVLVALVCIADDLPFGRLRRVPIGGQYLALLAFLTAGALLLLAILRRGLTPGRAAGLVALQLLGLVPVAIDSNPVMDARLFYPAPPPAVRHLRAAAARDPGRVLLGDAKNMGMLYGLHEVSGYDGMTPRRVEQLASPVDGVGLLGSGALNVTAGLGSPAVDLLGIRRVLLPPGTPAPAPHFVLEYDGPDAWVYRNERALPPVWVAGRARCLDESEARGQILAGAADVRAEVLLVDGCAGGAGGDTPAPAGRAEIVRSAPGRLVVRAETDTAAYLVVSDAWFPGWRAEVAGKDTPVLLADTVFKAVRIPPGRTEVRLDYRPRSFAVGLGLTGVGVAATLLCLLAPRLRRRAAVVIPAACTLLAPGIVHALPMAPFELTATPPVLGEGEPVMVRLDPVDGATDPGHLFDVYVVQIPGGRPVVRYLSPTGVWSAVPSAYLTWLAGGRAGPLVVAWRESGPAGWITLVVVFVRTSANPGHRAAWVYQPLMTHLRIRAAPAGGPGARLLPLAPLALAALVAGALVIGYSIRPRGRAPSGSASASCSGTGGS